MAQVMGLDRDAIEQMLRIALACTALPLSTA